MTIHNRGFLTLEMLIAFTVLSLSLGALTLLLSGNRALSVDAEVGGDALSLSQRILENAQALARKDFRLVNSTTSIENIGGLLYTKSINVSTTTNSITGLEDYFSKKVTANISWAGLYNRAQSVNLSSLISNFENVAGGDTCNSNLSGNWSSPLVTNTLLGSLVGDSAGTYAISDIDVFEHRLYVSINQGSQSTGANNPETAADISGSGNVGWNNPNNIKAGSDSSATSQNSLNNTRITNYLKATNFGFTIPQGATILGIKVEVQRNRSGGSSGSVLDKEVRIVRGNGTTGVLNKANTGTSWPSSESYASYGGNSDLWGESWSATDINSSNFGALISATGSSGGNRNASVDHIRITVIYIKQFYVLSTANASSPQFISGLGSNSIGTGFNAIAAATSSLFAYVYAATNAGPATGQLQVIDIGGVSPVATTTYVVPGVTGTGIQAVGNSIFYKNGYVYLGLSKTQSGPEFNIIDVHDVGVHFPPTLQIVGSYAVGAGVNSIYVKGEYAYVGTDDNNREFMVLNIRNPLSPVLYTTYNAPGAVGFGYGKTQYMVGDTLYLGRTYVSNAPEFTILDASTTSFNSVGSKDVGPNSSNAFSVNGLIVRDYLVAVLTGSSSKAGQLQLINIQNAGVLTTPATINLPNSGSGISLDCEGNYLYAASVPQSGSFQNRGSISAITASP